MWATAQEKISQAIDRPFLIKARSPLTGGDINTAVRVTDGKDNFFVKYNDINQLASFQAEALSLKTLLQTETINVPKVIAIGHDTQHAFLILTFHDIEKNDKSSWAALGAALAKLHNTTCDNQYGWQNDNFIGTSQQHNRWHKNWATFFAEQRIGSQLKLLANNGVNIKNQQKVLAKCRQILEQFPITPSLLHGDLWQGNVGFEHGQPIIFDPASYYGDRETDIAMTELFGGFPSAFYQRYFSELPASPNYEVKKHVYNLYHILNHANMFGGHYIDQAKDIIKTL